MHAGNAWAPNLTIWSQVDSHCVESAPALNLSGTEQFSLLSHGFFTSHGVRQVPYTLSYILILDTVLSRLLTERNTDRHFFFEGARKSEFMATRTRPLSTISAPLGAVLPHQCPCKSTGLLLGQTMMLLVSLLVGSLSAA